MGESKEYMTLPEENGSINISEEVIAAIAVGAVRDVEGVSGMVTAMGGSVTDLVHNKKNAQKGAKGVKIDMTGAALVLDIYLTVEYGHPIPTVAENAQKAVIFCAPEAVARLRQMAQNYDRLLCGGGQHPRGRRDAGLSPGWE